MLELQPITFKEASEFVKAHHRHHIPTVGWKFGMALTNGKGIVGVIIVGRPVARHLDNGWTLEVTRCCTDGTRNACSKLYRAAWNITKNLGYKRLITYTLASESGSSLKAAGYNILYQTKGGTWDRPNRKRVDKHPIGEKLLWEIK